MTSPLLQCLSLLVSTKLLHIPESPSCSGCFHKDPLLILLLTLSGSHGVWDICIYVSLPPEASVSLLALTIT